MITAEIQVHGYRKGHQLLASSIVLLKEDQVVVDRLSDVAGPLRPREQFPPYLSAYPLPGGTYYVIARTWQDLSIPRAGCVRTKSVLLNAEAWSRMPPLMPILRVLGSVDLPNEEDALRIKLEEQTEEQLLPAPKFNASELIEALFLEDVKPIVVFDVPEPELIAVRLLAALWPNIRRRFALSTFALSPRKIEGRDFNLVFAPSSAKAKFSDWLGRRIDGCTSQSERHRWTGAIVRRVFEEPIPRLLSNRDIDLLGDHDSDSAAALRIALLWDELLVKLDQAPTAALGLLDIASSGMVSSAVAVKSLEPQLADATHRAIGSMSLNDAWDFIGAITRKMQGYDIPSGRAAVEQMAAHLSERAPDGAVSLLRQADPKGAIDDLVPCIAMGLGNGAAPHVEEILLQAPLDILVKLVSQGGALTSRVAGNDALIGRMGVALTEVDHELAYRTGMVLLPLLVEDRQLPAAMPILGMLNAQETAAELRWLGSTNDFKAERMGAFLVAHAREIGGLSAVRDVLSSSDASDRRDALLSQTIEPVGVDVLWLLDEKRLSETTSNALLVGALRRANDRQFVALLSDWSIGERLVARTAGEADDILARAAIQDRIPVNLYARIVMTLIPRVDAVRKFEIAMKVLGRCLQSQLDKEELAILPILLDILGTRLDGGWAVRAGLERGINAEIASRNLEILERAPMAARKRIVGAVDEIARAMQGRQGFDLSEAANNACAKLMFDAEEKSPKALVEAAGWLIPSLLSARRQPVSLLIAALFPMIYRELAAPTLLKSFFDRDRRRTAREQLVQAFLWSSWKAGDLALTAYRCQDVAKILKQLVRLYRGENYLKQIENDLGRLNDDGKREVKRTITEIRSGSSYKVG